MQTRVNPLIHWWSVVQQWQARPCWLSTSSSTSRICSSSSNPTPTPSVKESKKWQTETSWRESTLIKPQLHRLISGKKTGKRCSYAVILRTYRLPHLEGAGLTQRRWARREDLVCWLRRWWRWGQDSKFPLWSVLLPRLRRYSMRASLELMSITYSCILHQ